MNRMDSLKLRKAMPSDSEFAYRVKKAAFRRYVEQVWGWDEEEQRRLQLKRFSSQEFSVIQLSGVDVGIIAVVKEPDCVKLNQIFILPEYQGKGIGKACVKGVVDDAAADGLSVQLRVLKVNNRGIAFFRKLGFKETGESDTHIQMERPL
jgi:ribosomal protein S18 acetylase RimI-like enzyme